MSKFEKGIITISVDDGRKDAYRLAKEVLPKYNIPATFNITTAFVDKNNTGNTGSITLNELEEMYKNPLVEIAGHGHAHKNDDDDIIHGRELLYKWLDIKDETIGFASPGSGLKNNHIKENANKLRDMGYLYIRSGISVEEPTASHEKVKEQIKDTAVSDYVIKNVNQLSYGFDSMCVNSVIVFNYTSVEELKQLVDVAASEKACLTFMFHGITKDGEADPENLWCFSFDKFLQFAEYLSQKRDNGEIEVLTTKEAFLKGEQ